MPPVSGSGPPAASTHGWIAGWIVPVARVDGTRPPAVPSTLVAMAMGNRPGVETAQAPIAALDVALLAQQLAAAMIRVPFRRPLRQGGSNPAANMGICITREVIRSFMGYTSSLPIPEFRSVELVLDDICKVIMPPVVRSLDVQGHPAELGGVPGILYRPKKREPTGVILYLHGGGYIGTSPQMYAFFTARVCSETDCAVFVADYRLAPEFPYPAGADDATAVYNALRELGVPNERLFLAGDSGGGGLANSMLLVVRGGPGPDDRPGRAPPLLPRGRPAPRRALGHRERQARHPALEHPDGQLPARRGRLERVHLAAGRQPRRLPAHLRGLGRRRNVPRSHPALRRSPRGGRCADPRPRVRGHVPRLPDPHALGREEPPDLRPPPDLRAEAGGRRPDVRSRRPARPARPLRSLRELTSSFSPA